MFTSFMKGPELSGEIVENTPKNKFKSEFIERSAFRFSDIKMTNFFIFFVLKEYFCRLPYIVD